MEPFENVPDTDFAVADNRDRMTAALAEVRESFGRDYPLVVAGESVTTGQWIESTNPAQPAQVVGRVAAAGVEDVDRAVAAARDAAGAWRNTSPAERAAMLENVAQQMIVRRFELAALVVYEVGKPWREADADVSEAVDFCRFYGREMQRLSDRPRRRDFPGEDNRLVYEPCGVVAVIAPWNFPLAILTGMASAALAAGNTVVLKPAEQSSVIAAMLMQMFIRADFPPGVVQYLPGSGEVVGKALVEHPGVNLIAFTGSRAVGCAIYESASKLRPGQEGLKRVIAEMGGKNATIIDDDADLDEAVSGVIAAAFGYAGQKCSACSRVIVHQAVHDAFVARLTDAASSLRIGPPAEPGTMMGPVVDAEALEKIRRYIEIGRSEATLALEVDVSGCDGGGYYVGPTLFTDVAPDARIAQEEIFGPVLAVIRADSFEQALEFANGTEFALTGGIYSRSPAHIKRVKRDLRVGNVYINRKITGAIVDRQPFGGFKMSGMGSKAGGPDYLRQFTNPRTITENTLRHGFAPVEPGG
jgi:RHH-type proline utilization regulon transcriptional repressor/proline dehydrogenase/delta 1-pyrroline-5-carboxylate dehydrogenase